MKLKSCHINGFGIYKNKDFSFDNLCQFLSENGSGKSTLADFIKYMLYDLKKDMRLKYAPFEEGAFGGSLILEADGKEYRIEKEFDKKSATKDIETIYVNNNKTEIKGLGNYLFKIDEEGFSRTIFINGKDLSIASSSSINSKLNSLVSKTDDEFDIDDVLKKLGDIKKLYGTSAKVSSYLIRDNAKLKELNDEKIKLKNLEAAFASNYEELKAKEEALKALEQEIKSKEEINEKAIIYEKYKALKLEISKLLNNALEIKQKYPKILSKDELAEIKADLEEYNNLSIKINNKNSSNNLELEKLKELFKANPLTKEDINLIDNKINNLTLKKSQLNNSDLLIIDEEDIKRFENVNVEEEIEEAKKEYIKYQDLNDKLIASSEIRKEKNNFNFYFITIIGSLILISGIILLALRLFIPGAIISSIGLIITLISLFLAFKPKNDNNDNKTDLQYEYRKSERRLGDILARYRYNDENYALQLNHLENDYKKYKGNLEHNKKINDSNKLLEKEIDNLKKEIEEFFNKYLNVYDEYSESLRLVSNKFNRYNDLLKEKEAFEENNILIQNRIDELTNKINPILKEYNITFDDASKFFEQMNIDLHQLDYFERSINENKNNLDKYIIDNNINVDEEFVKIDLQDLKNEYSIFQKEYVDLDKIIKDNEDLLERLPYLEEECEILEEKIKEYKHKYNIYENVINFLKVSDNNLKEKYIRPLKDGFIKYAQKLNSIFKDNITFDGDFNLKLERSGKLVDDIHLSQGEITVRMLCYRLALIDNMYEEKPFIILDDPFVNLDAKNLDYSLKLIKDLSEETQIIYFTCIENRKV